jgi:hypothetical protein
MLKDRARLKQLDVWRHLVLNRLKPGENKKDATSLDVPSRLFRQSLLHSRIEIQVQRMTTATGQM